VDGRKDRRLVLAATDDLPQREANRRDGQLEGPRIRPGVPAKGAVDRPRRPCKGEYDQRKNEFGGRQHESDSVEQREAGLEERPLFHGVARKTRWTEMRRMHSSHHNLWLHEEEGKAVTRAAPLGGGDGGIIPVPGVRGIAKKAAG